jgi:hypothetical protein
MNVKKRINNKTVQKNILLVFILFFLGCIQNDKSELQPELIIDNYKNGNLKYIGYMIGDKKVGEWREFREEELFSIINYKNGVKHGKVVSYEICSGKILEEGQYNNGERIGLWYFYSEGELVSVSEYKNDSGTIIHHNPKFREASEIPPPPNRHYCDKLSE